ncbi:alpha/beta fold hydrolase [Herbiconiux daphne]|uniref:Alpha/beta hydrolase n=1 Tax=Herbiconiux daphne TaxID=2970914 RepID=A0ABT2H5L6_9MICO|nr:alpha/beta hydrolase [Herbiconiux daphne]MCS5735250.1 alpha/beta hydrolase [Herbiconiux daphne]
MSDALGPIRQLDAGELNVGYADLGPSDGPVVLLLHGWPYDIHSYADAAPRLTDAGYRVLVPHLRGYGSTRFLAADAAAGAPGTAPRASEGTVPRNGQQAVFALDAIALLDALGVTSAVVAGFDWGARTANILAALWPDRCRAHVAVSGYLIGSQQANAAPLPPAAELAWWYQFYFATPRGREGYDRYRAEFARLIWQTASPRWSFDDAVFDRSAAAFENPDHVDIVIDNYRWRLGLSRGDPRHDDLERRLAGRPPIAVPTITLEGDANGAPHPDAPAYRAMFTGPYEHRVVTGGVGHNLPQEAPAAFADAVIAADRAGQQAGWGPAVLPGIKPGALRDARPSTPPDAAADALADTAVDAPVDGSPALRSPAQSEVSRAR